MHITVEMTQTYDLYKFDTARSYDSTLVEILPAQHEVKRQKRSNDQTENGKCKNVTNCRSRVASQPHFDYFTHCQIRQGASAGSTWQLQEYTTKLSENILKLRSIFCENVSRPARK